MTWQEYERQAYHQQCSDAIRVSGRTVKDFEAEHQVKTGRDNYGWRSIPAGSRYMGAPKQGLTK